MKGVVWKSRGSLLAHHSVVSVQESGAAKHVARPQVHPKHTHTTNTLHMCTHRLTHILTHSPHLHTHSHECTHIPHTYYKHILHTYTHTPTYNLTQSPHWHTNTTPHHTTSRTRLSSSFLGDLLLGSWKDCMWWHGIGWNGPGSPRILFIKMKACHMDQIRAQKVASGCKFQMPEDEHNQNPHFSYSLYSLNVLESQC